MVRRRCNAARCVWAAIVVAVLGLALVGCGGGDGGALSDLSVTRTDVEATGTATLPDRSDRTEQTEPPAESSAEAESTARPEPPASEEAPDRSQSDQRETVTVIETDTAPAPTKEKEPATAASEPKAAAPAESASSSDDTPWAWFLLIVALAGAAVVALVVWFRRRGSAGTWSVRMEELERRALVTLDEVFADGSVVTGRVQALASEARTLEASAPDEGAQARAGRVRAGFDQLAGVLEADRSLRLRSPPPSDEQLRYSTALIREQVERLQPVLRPYAEVPPPAPPAEW